MNRLRLHFLFTVVTVISLGFFKAGQAFTIGGKVTDQNSGYAVIGADVLIIDTDSGSVDSLVTDRSGEWHFDSESSIPENRPPLPSGFRVYPNYPNPFNPATTVHFSIPTAGEVELLVHDLLGREIARKRRYLPAGDYRFTWHGGAAAGVYFYTVRHAGQSRTRKMVQLDGSGVGGGHIGIVLPGSPQFYASLAKPSELPLRIIISKFEYIPDTISAEIEGGEYFETNLETIHHHATLIDLHNDILEKMLVDTSYHLMPRHSYNHTDIPRLIEGGVDIQFFAVWVDPDDHSENPHETALECIDIFRTEVARYPGYIQQANTLQEALTINVDHKIAGVLAVEGGHAIENSIDKLIALYEAGMRYMTITWNNSTEWAVSARDEYYNNKSGGLNDFGRRVIRTMDSLGVIIDVSHTGIETIEDILEVTENPIVATHSGVRALEDRYRNLYDSQIHDIANSGGVIGVVFYPPFLGDYHADIQDVIRHIDYIVELVGIDYVALGSDFDGIGTNTVRGLDDTSKFPDLTLALLEQGYSRRDVEKILGRNFIRVFQAVCGSGEPLP